MLRVAGRHERLSKTLERSRHEEGTYRPNTTAVDDRVARYRHDHHERLLGGQGVFEPAREGLLTWQAHAGAGLRIYPPLPPTEGLTVLVLIRLGPLEVIAPCRVVRVIDEPDRYGFAYGTLPGHPEVGEETFLVERGAGRTAFKISAVSRPAALIARAGGPITRGVQLRTTRKYLQALATYVENAERADRGDRAVRE